MKNWQVIEGDSLKVLPTLAENSVDAVVTDPPYFRVKDADWDTQWKNADGFIDWLDGLVAEWQRILKPNGSIYCFASPQMAARVELAIGRKFNVLNSIVWSKAGEDGVSGSGHHRGSCKDDLRAFFPATERVVFAEHYGADNIAKGEAGYVAKCDELRGFVFEPLRAYLVGEFSALGWNVDRLVEICGKTTASHYVARSQWCLPTKEHYHSLQLQAGKHLRREYEYLRREYEYLRREYEYLRREYEDLRREYEDLRRPFAITSAVPFTDVWVFPTVNWYKGKHPCEKPVDLMRHIVSASTKPGAVVLDCFAGSGSTGVACAQLGRRFIGIELSPEYCEIARARITAAEAAKGEK